SCVFISTRQNARALMESKHIFTAATACRLPPPSITSSQAARPRPIVECGGVVTTCCERRGSRQCWSSADFQRTRRKGPTPKALLIGKNLQQRLRPESAVVLRSRAHRAGPA